MLQVWHLVEKCRGLDIDIRSDVRFGVHRVQPRGMAVEAPRVTGDRPGCLPDMDQGLTGTQRGALIAR